MRVDQAAPPITPEVQWAADPLELPRGGILLSVAKFVDLSQEESEVSTKQRDIILSIIRHGLTLGAGALIASGKLDEAGGNELVAALMAIIGIAWGIKDKFERVDQ